MSSTWNKEIPQRPYADWDTIQHAANMVVKAIRPGDQGLLEAILDVYDHLTRNKLLASHLAAFDFTFTDQEANELENMFYTVNTLVGQAEKAWFEANKHLMVEIEPGTSINHFNQSGIILGVDQDRSAYYRMRVDHSPYTGQVPFEVSVKFEDVLVLPTADD